MCNLERHVHVEYIVRQARNRLPILLYCPITSVPLLIQNPFSRLTQPICHHVDFPRNMPQLDNLLTDCRLECVAFGLSFVKTSRSAWKSISISTGKPQITSESLSRANFNATNLSSNGL